MARHFADLVRRTRGWNWAVDVSADPGRAVGDIAFVIEPAAAAGSPESYSLSIRPKA